MHNRFLAATTVALSAATALILPSSDAATTRSHAQTHVVSFGEYFYRPRKITIRAGDSVRFVNVGKIQHTVADSSKSGTIRSRVIPPRPLGHGKSQTVRFKRRGTIYYLCTFHPSLMRGVIVVR